MSLLLRIRLNETMSHHRKSFRLVTCLLAVTLALTTTSCSRRPSTGATVHVLAAASLCDVLHAMSADMHAAGLDVKGEFGATGALRREVEHGAPADVIITASPGAVRRLLAEKLVTPSSACVVYRNHLVLVAPKDGEVKTLADLARARRIGIGDPASVPAGRYGAEALRSLGLFDELRPRLVYGSDVRVVLEWVAQGDVDAGLMYTTDARVEAARVRVVATIPDRTHAPILYGCATIKGCPDPAGAARFLAVLRSPSAQAIARNAGFEPITQPLPPAGPRVTRPSSSARSTPSAGG